MEYNSVFKYLPDLTISISSTLTLEIISELFYAIFHTFTGNYQKIRKSFNQSSDIRGPASPFFVVFSSLLFDISDGFFGAVIIEKEI